MLPGGPVVGGVPVQNQEQVLANKTIALMNERGIPPVPENYELFYLYVSGSNPEATRAVEDVFRSGGAFTPQVLDDLRVHYIGSERTNKAIEDVGANIGIALETVLGKLEDAGKHAGDYGRALSAVSGGLGSDQSPAAVRKLVDGLLGATKAMEARTKSLESELSCSTQQITDLKIQLDTVRKESRTDALTGIANRKTFDIELEDAVAAWKEEGQQVSLLMCDIDHFKNFNDTWGHQTGDQVLRLVANCLSENVKGRDTAARYGGEEFAVILRHTGINDAINLANQIRANVESKKLVKKSTGEILGAITISIGVTEARGQDAGEDLIRRADVCLYRAKQTGRNRVIGQSPMDKPEHSSAA
jgi:diguanylate cyclase